MRIVSLVPAATDWLIELDLADSIVGISHESAGNKALVGIPTLTSPSIILDGNSAEIDRQIREQIENGAPSFFLNDEELLGLKPDVIICQQHCGVCAIDGSEVSKFARENDLTTFFFDPLNFREVLQQLIRMSNSLGCLERGMKLAGDVELRIKNLQEQIGFDPKADSPSLSLALIEWIDPIFLAGNWIPQMIELLGLKDACDRTHNQSVEISLMTLMDMRADFLIIAPCDFTIEDSLSDLPGLYDRYVWKDLKAVQKEQVYVADGLRYFNRPGPNLIRSLELMALAVYKEKVSHMITVGEDEIIQLKTFER